MGLSWNADAGIFHRESQGNGVVGLVHQVDAHVDFPGGREFQRITDEVQQRLPEPDRVAAEAAWNRTRHVAGEFKAFPLSRSGKEFHGVIHRVLKIKVQLFQLEFAGFDFGEVEDVIDDREERLAGLLNGAREVALPGIEGGRE